MPFSERQNGFIIAPVGAAIGRPSVKTRSDVKQNASAEKKFAIVTGRADAKTIRTILNADSSPAAGGRTSDARPYNDAAF